MKFWREHAGLRLVIMIVFFAAGLGLVIGGWTMTGEAAGLLLMLAGLVLLLTTPLVYNKGFE